VVSRVQEEGKLVASVTKGSCPDTRPQSHHEGSGIKNSSGADSKWLYEGSSSIVAAGSMNLGIEGGA